VEGPEAGAAAEAAVDVGVAATQATAVGAGAQVEIAAEDGDEQARSTCIPSRTISALKCGGQYEFRSKGRMCGIPEAPSANAMRETETHQVLHEASFGGQALSA